MLDPPSESERQPGPDRPGSPGGAVAPAPRGPWHSLDTDEVLRALESDAHRGLSGAEARRRLDQHGPNRLREEARESALVRFLKQFHNILIYILLAAALLTALPGEWIDTGVILAVVLVNALIGFVQEGKAEAALEGIRRMLSLEATVIREGRRRRVPAEALVPGDLVLLEGGDRVPADLRLLAARNARVEEAALTGESVPVEKSPEPVLAETVLGDRRNMAFSGTLVAAGHLRGVVVATGAATEIGRIGEMVSRVERLTTPLLERIGRFGTQLSVAILSLAAALFVVGWVARDYPLAALFMIVVSFAVAAIPEGLPAILTITLALGVQRMARRNAIVRRLPAVETLGSVTTICSDKTGTLTRNEMTAARVITASHVFHVTGSGYAPEGRFELDGRPVSPDEHPVLREIGRASLLCNDAGFSPDPATGARVLQGDPTEGALLVLGEKAGFGIEEETRAWPRLDVIPFESESRFMATLNADPQGKRWIFLKGAPERVLAMCERARAGDGDLALDREAWRQRTDAVAGEGFRMLAVAVKAATRGHDRLATEDVQDGFTLLAVTGLIDPPRPEAIEAVDKCRSAGIRVKMITGDHALTARSIGAQMGIGEGRNAITGQEIEAASDAELVDLAREHDVFARSSPEHKLRLVRALQARGEVAAMTGDGVNDAPALRQADIGVAMGIKGTEAAKSAAEMVLADDNFATIERAVEEGRTVYDNLKKTILFILPTNGAEALMVVSTVAFAFTELPITPVQILWVNMITAVTLALALAFEPPEPGIMDRPPRPRQEPILSGYLLWRIAFVAVIVAAASQFLFLRELGLGGSPEQARTVAVNTLVAGQLFYLFNARYLRESSLGVRRLSNNRVALIAVAVLLVVQACFTYVPLFQTWFGTAGLVPVHWVWVLLTGLAVFVLVEAEKAVVRWGGGRSRAGRPLGPAVWPGRP
jgi:magnesium-transporting ATPase (P-type)